MSTFQDVDIKSIDINDLATYRRGRKEIVMDDLLTNSEAAALLRVQPQTLRKWRLTGRGPRFIKLAGPYSRALYVRADLEAWIQQHMYASTAEQHARAAGACAIRRGTDRTDR
jgi:hypothetical protein